MMRENNRIYKRFLLTAVIVLCMSMIFSGCTGKTESDTLNSDAVSINSRDVLMDEGTNDETEEHAILNNNSDYQESVPGGTKVTLRYCSFMIPVNCTGEGAKEYQTATTRYDVYKDSTINDECKSARIHFYGESLDSVMESMNYGKAKDNIDSDSSNEKTGLCHTKKTVDIDDEVEYYSNKKAHAFRTEDNEAVYFEISENLSGEIYVSPAFEMSIFDDEIIEIINSMTPEGFENE